MLFTHSSKSVSQQRQDSWIQKAFPVRGATYWRAGVIHFLFPSRQFVQAPRQLPAELLFERLLSTQRVGVGRSETHTKYSSTGITPVAAGRRRSLHLVLRCFAACAEVKHLCR